MTDAERLIGDMFKAKEKADDVIRQSFDKVCVVVGDYAIWGADEEKVGITCTLTGESGVFKKADLQPYIKLFFNNHF